MELCMRESSRIIGLLEKESTSGPMGAFMKARSKMGWDMVTEYIRSKMPHTKENGNKARNKVRGKLFSKVAAYLKAILKMIWSQAWVRCITILPATILRETGSTIWKKAEEPWTGQTWGKNILESGIKIISMVGESISGCNPKVKENIWETDTKGTGQMESEKGTVSFTMQMELNTKGIGRTTWNKGMLSILTRMVKFHIFYSIVIGC